MKGELYNGFYKHGFDVYHFLVREKNLQYGGIGQLTSYQG
jgi:hypothetical protein